MSDTENHTEDATENREFRQDNGRRDEEMVNVKHSSEYRNSGARFTRLLVVVGILGVVVFSVAALTYVVSGSIPFPTDIF